MKTKFNFPLSFDDISHLLGKNDEIITEVEGFVMIKKSKSPDALKDLISEQIFKNLYDEWKANRTVVVGQDKLLTQGNLKQFEIKEQSDSINNMVVMHIKALLCIEQDPEYKEEIQKDRKALAKKEKEVISKMSL